MRNAVWPEAIKSSADVERARHFYTRLKESDAAETLRAASVEQARVLAALFSGSHALSELLVANPKLMGEVDAAKLEHPRQLQGFWREIKEWLPEALANRGYPVAYRQIREFKQKELLRIAARDLARLGTLEDTMGELSNLADVCLETVLRIAWQQLTERLGQPYHEEPEALWQVTRFCVLGMGKLGGQELNYSSDVDLLFVYSAEGFVFKQPPRKGEVPRGIPNHQFFKQLSELFIAEVAKMAPEGALFRIDMRLRPEGKTGPLARSVASYEHYYAQWGQTWERMMLIKARCVAGDSMLAAEFLEMIQPFRFPRAIGEQIPREVGEMKLRIENEVIKEGQIERNVKLGRGGIREIEFVAQTLQVLHAGKTPFLQGGQTLPTIDKLVRYQLLKYEDAQALRAAYCFLRDVEHRLQMEDNRQTHSLPTERKARERIARLMNFETLAAFERQLKTHTERVRAIYGQIIRIDQPRSSDGLPRDFEDGAGEWRRILKDHSFVDPERSLGLLREFAEGPGYGHISSRTNGLALELIARILALCPQKERPARSAAGRDTPEIVLSDPDRVIARLDSYVSAYGARSTLYEAWNSNPSLFRLLLLLIDRSEYLAERVIRSPDLLDQLEQSGQLRRRKNAEQVLLDLRHGIKDEDQIAWIRRYHQAEQMRIGLRDILALASAEETQRELSDLADGLLAYALEVIVKHHQLKSLPFAVIGLGKLGGRELIYGSDLDVIFIAPDAARSVPKLQQLAVELMNLLNKHTEHGRAFEVDARLRPDGEKGLLVNTLQGAEEYYHRRALLWELQSLTRTRFIAGDAVTGAQFKNLANALIDFSNERKDLSGWRPDWKDEIARMRQRIEKERTPSGKAPLALKTGQGGLIDVEFIGQMCCLQTGTPIPNTLTAVELGHEAGLLDKDNAAELVANYKQLLEIERILRRWSFDAESVLPDDAAALYRVAVRCGFEDVLVFLTALEQWRQKIRTIYNKVFAIHSIVK